MDRYGSSILPLLIVACAGPPPPKTTVVSSPALSPIQSSIAASTTAAGTSGRPPISTEPDARSEEQNTRDAARVPLATAVTDAYANWNSIFSTLVANWSPDGKHFLFGSQRDGMPQIYLADVAAPGAPPKALTTGPERAIWARYTADGMSILFLRDSKGDENHHIFRISPDGTGLLDLTPGEVMHRGEPVLPQSVPGLMLYAGARPTDPSTTLFAQSTTKRKARRVYTNPRPSNVLNVTSDGSRALFVDYHSTDEMVLWDVDVASGKPWRIYPSEEKKVTLTSATYSPDGMVAYVSTDEGTESSVLIAIDARTGRELLRYTNESPKSAPMSAIVSPRGDRIAVQIDAGNHGEVRVLDAKTLKAVRSVKVPLGLVQIGRFRDDGQAFSLLISLPDHPADVFGVDAATGDVKPLRRDARRGLESLPAVDASISHAKAFDGLDIPINQYLPRGERTSAKRLPTLVVFHGGPAYSYAVRWSAITRFFLALGYAVIEPNVRGSTGFGRAYEMADNREKRADWLKDVSTVNAWAKSQPWCDPHRVVVFGGSYGGYTTLMALTRQPTLWRAGVDLFGLADLKTFLRNTDAGIRSAFVAEFGDLDRDGPLLEAWSPMSDVDKIVAPLFVYAGQNDPRVPRSESDAIVQALRKRKVPVEYMVAANEGHTLDRRETMIELLTRVSRFLDDAMSPAKAEQNPAQVARTRSRKSST